MEPDQLSHPTPPDLNGYRLYAWAPKAILRGLGSSDKLRIRADERLTHHLAMPAHAGIQDRERDTG
jgi:hypothetical protein